MESSPTTPVNLLRKLRHLFLLGIVLASIKSAGALDPSKLYGVPVDILCALFDAFVFAAAVLGGLLMVIAGITWLMSRDDPAKRNAAKTAVIHIIVGLLIVSIAAAIISGVTIKDWENTDIQFGNVCNSM